ncbi:MAG TPA: choice-of-anchor Q domain-containing protein, partial [Anaerolineae bacterium]|nr:choice-of-anchor Q domain-containing protein [Anaerolineae bacterium]
LMTGGLVQNNVAGNDGGGIYGTQLVISGTRIISNAGNDGGGVFAVDALAITNTLLDNNKARIGNGGGIFASGNVTISLAGTSSVSKTTISNNTAITNGGGIFAVGNVNLIGEALFSSNDALNGEGGALYTNDVFDNSGNSVLLIVRFTGNTALGNGGAIRALGRVNLLNSPAFQNNIAGGGTTADGGAVYATGNVFLSRGTSTGNSARNGGAVYALGDVTFNVHDTGPNQAALNGGCVYASQHVIYNSADAIACSAGQNGGAAYSPLTITLSANGVGVFRQNHAGASGGVAYANRVEIRNAPQVFSNTASLDGGVAAGTGVADISDSTITTNTARFRGGAVTMIGTALITNSIFSSNRLTDTTGRGGAVWVTGTVVVSNSSFLTNTLSGFTSAGGAIGATGRVSLSGGVIQGNQATTGAGVRSFADVIATGTLFQQNTGNSNSSGGGLAAITATLTGVTMTANSVCCTAASGGAVSATLAFISGSTFIQNSSFISGGAVIANQVFVTSSQFMSNTGANEGAAIWTRGGVISNTQFTANSTGCCSSRAGGALFVRGTIVVNDSQFTGNQSDHGGAINLIGNSSEIRNSTFANNFVDCCGGGGAIAAVGFGPFIYNTTFDGNHVDCCDDGGAIRADQFLDVDGGSFSNNYVSTGDGGAIFVPIGFGGASVISGSTFISNSASQRGGAISVYRLDLRNATLISNTGSFEGGGLYVDDAANVSDSIFDQNKLSNTSGCFEGGAIGTGPTGNLSLLRSTFTRNQAGRGGAVQCSGGCTIDQSAFSDNTAFCLDTFTLSNLGTGGAVMADRFLDVLRSSFLRNSAGSPGGGGIFANLDPAASLSIKNSLFAGNTAANSVLGAKGAALIISNTQTSQILYNTFVSNTPNNISAIAVFSGTASLVDNIIAGHAPGVERVGGSVFENLNLFFNTPTNLSGMITSGGGSFVGDPKWVAPASDNYHLGNGSAALDAGSNVGVFEDYDGDVRPFGAGFDIGFDERQVVSFDVYLPLVLR